MELWKSIEDFPNYEVSDLGNVRNISTGKHLTKTPVEKGGYLTVTIGGKRRKVHRLVAVAFIPNPNNLPQVHHKDNDVVNNAASNLEWICNAENNKTVNKTQRKQIRRFTKREVFYIHKHTQTKTAKELAERYGCIPDSISKVWRGVGERNNKWKGEFYSRETLNNVLIVA
jgi:hypothetical protein